MRPPLSLRLRDYDAWAWALGIGLIWADSSSPVPQIAIIAALGIVYGAVLGGLVGSFALITSGLLAYLLMRTHAARCAATRGSELTGQDGRFL